MKIRYTLLTRMDIDHYFDHMLRQSQESRMRDSLIYGTLEPREFLDYNRRPEHVIEKWERPLYANDWSRTWGVFDGDKLVANLQIDGAKKMCFKHRVNLSMAVEKEYRSKGIGKKMMETAIAWLKSQKDFEWVDLDVFSHNGPALGLYKRFGFKETGRINDYTRIQDQKIDTILMSLNLQ